MNGKKEQDARKNFLFSHEGLKTYPVLKNIELLIIESMRDGNSPGFLYEHIINMLQWETKRLMELEEIRLKKAPVVSIEDFKEYKVKNQENQAIKTI